MKKKNDKIILATVVCIIVALCAFLIQRKGR